MKKRIIVNNKEYTSILEAAKEYNIPYNTIVSRLDAGWSIEEAFGLTKNYNRFYNNTIIYVDGKKYLSIKKACEYYKLNYSTVISRLNSGWTPDEAFEIVSRSKPKKRNKEINSINIDTQQLINICKKYNKKYNKVYIRIKRGWTLEEALELRLDENKELILHGRKFNNIREAMIAYRFPLVYVIKSMRDKNKTIQDIFHIKNNEELIVGKKHFNSIEEALNYANLPNKIYFQRLRKGWYIEEIIAGKRISSSSRSIIYKGKEFKNYRQLSIYYNIDYINLCARIRRGWTLDQAVKGERKNKRRN